MPCLYVHAADVWFSQPVKMRGGGRRSELDAGAGDLEGWPTCVSCPVLVGVGSVAALLLLPTSDAQLGTMQPCTHVTAIEHLQRASPPALCGIRCLPPSQFRVAGSWSVALRQH
jgi:hypothetical protein